MRDPDAGFPASIAARCLRKVLAGGGGPSEGTREFLFLQAFCSSEIISDKQTPRKTVCCD